MRIGKRHVWLLGAVADASVIVSVVAIAVMTWRPLVYADSRYTAGGQCHDISWPQCGGAYFATPGLLALLA